MKSETRLDSVVFQLTPTRTRFDLVIFVNGKKEKIASGLLNPFLAHLKTAQEQIEKGGYSITLEPDTEADAAWFTKETVERFVRFVSNPEILERVSTIESEILQIENAIAIQSNDTLGLSTVEVRHSKPVEVTAGSKASVDPGAEKAIILYAPDSQTHASDSNGSAKQEENSKAQLLRVLETRKSVLQKEQGMAFARAIAAGFAVDNMSPLISFAESFGALRLMQACTQLIDLWKKKHETGQWIDVEAIEQPEFSYRNHSGIMLTTDSLKQKEHGEAWPVPGGDATTDSHREDEKVLPGPQEYFPGQFQHPPYAQWALHSPTGAPMFPPFPAPGMPYYPNYSGSVPYYHHPYLAADDPRLSTPVKTGSRRHSIENKLSNNGSDTWERSTKSPDGTDENLSDTEKERSHSYPSHNRVGRSGKKKSGVVVIQNLNYIASKKHGTGSESQSASDAETGEDTEELNPDSQERKIKRSHRSSGKDEDGSRSFRNSYNKDDAYEPEADAGNWQVFQNFLLRAEEKNRAADGALFSGEKAAAPKRRQGKNEADPLVQHGRDDLHEQQITGFDRFCGEGSKMKKTASGDEIIALSEGRGSADNQLKEIEGGRGRYRKMSSDEIMIYGREKHLSNRRNSDPIADGLREPVGNRRNKSLQNSRDESLLLPYRSQGHVAERTTAIDMNSEIPSSRAKAQDSRNKGNAQIRYEPDDYSLVPQRGAENVSTSYDPTLDNDLQIPVRNALKLEARNEISSKSGKDVLKKIDKDKKSKLPQDSSEKRRMEALTKKETSSRLNPSVEAQLRAQKLRSYKADMQKLKKEKEEEALKRLEALKAERQKRIAAKSNSAATKVAPITKQTVSRVPTKTSPSVTRGSKFSDAVPRHSPLTRLPVRTASMGSNDFKAKINKSTGITRSVSSLPKVKERNGLLSEAKVASLRTKRLSDPQGSSTQRASSLRSVARDHTPKKLPYEYERKKMTAIMQSDQMKSATLPELKIRTQKSLSDAVIKKPSIKEPTQKVGTSSQASVKSQANSNIERSRKFSNNEDNNLVIEKSVVTLEDNPVSGVVVQQDRKERLNRDRLAPEQAGNRAPPSPVSQVNSGVGKLDNHPNIHEAVVAHSKAESQKLSNSTTMEKPYQAPYARVSSFEEQLGTNTESYKAPYARATSLEETTGASAETEIATMSSEVVKPQSKEPKGFRKLLNLGRKSNSLTSVDGNLGSDSSTDDLVAASNNAPILKNLISQDDAHAGGTPPKVMRPFSLLSPFRSKTTEKKIAG